MIRRASYLYSTNKDLCYPRFGLVCNRVAYWDKIFNEEFDLPDNVFEKAIAEDNYNIIDDYIKSNLVEKLKAPEVMARLLGQK